MKDARGIELNTASEDELAIQVGLGPERASRIMANRPYRSWDDVRRVEGLTDAVVEALRGAGAELGDPAAAVVVPREEERALKPQERDVAERGRRL
ncbi:MAG TPA: helix-hairpin-helix domain-containing protein [Polyangiales bacterium]|nr:helix-hairpin-helix domain-containing protein [Polyangiales bacterium]